MLNNLDFIGPENISTLMNKHVKNYDKETVNRLIMWENEVNSQKKLIAQKRNRKEEGEWSISCRGWKNTANIYEEVTQESSSMALGTVKNWTA